MKPVLRNLTEAHQIFSALVKPTVLILLWMSLLRLVLFVGVFSGQIGFHPDLTMALFTGVRFDALVLGFLWIPILVLTWIWSSFSCPKKLFRLWKFYLIMAVLIIFYFSWLDLFWTAAKNLRLNHEFFEASQRIILDSGGVVLGRARSIVFTGAMISSCLGILLSIHWLPFPPEKTGSSETGSPLKIFLQAMVILFCVALAARGTWTAHHLNVEHAEVSENTLVNQIPLNPIWNMDK